MIIINFNDGKDNDKEQILGGGCEHNITLNIQSVHC